MSLSEYIRDFFNKKQLRKKKATHSPFSNFLRNYFTFHKQESKAIFAVLALILLFMAATFSYRFRSSTATTDNSEFQEQIDNFLASAQMKQDADTSRDFIADEISRPSKAPAQLFMFNPNTATEDDFIKLGLSKKQATGILNYRNKGGKFKKKEDFAKIYTISKKEYERLETFIEIPETEKTEVIYAGKKSESKETVLVEINTADSLALIQIKGVKGYTAMKILEQRKKLGGFYNKEQLLEVYPIDSARFEQIKSFITVDPIQVKKININKVTLDELKVHPYIPFKIANSIIAIRQQHGHFNSIDAIRKSHLVTEDVFRKIAPYLTIE